MVYGKSRLGITAVVLVLGLFLLGGCGEKKSKEQKAEEAARVILKDSTGKDVNVKVQQGKIEIEQQGVKSEITQTSTWPPDMFPEVPQFTFGQIKQVHKFREQGGLVKFNVVYGNVESDALNKYANMLKQYGWQLNIIQTDGKGGMVTGQKGKLGISMPFNMEKKEAVLMVYNTK
jgi:hypothetical protein